MAEEFPNRIRELRTGRNWTVRELGDRSGIGFNTIHKLETGAVSLDVERMRRIAKAFDVKPSCLLNDEDVEFRADQSTEVLLSDLMTLPVEQRGNVLRVAVEVSDMVRSLAAQQSAAALSGNLNLIRKLADIWNGLNDDARETGLDLWKSAKLSR